MSEDYKHLQLDYQLCFAVYATSNAFVRAYNHLLEAFGLSYPAYLVMLVAWQEDRQSVERIAEQLHLPVKAVDPVIRKLEAQGYLMRRVALNKPGEIEIIVTAEGNALKDDVHRIRGEIGCMIGISDEKLLDLRGDLLNVLAALEDEINRLKPAKYSYV